MSALRIEVVYALPGRQVLRTLLLPDGSVLSDAVCASGLSGEFPEIDAARAGIHGNRAAPGTPLRDGDRVELYRPLSADPKEIRRKRARRK